jgi:hypothetical protein
MIKKILISVGLLIVLVGGGLFLYLDSIVKSGIEVVGSSVLGTEVTVGSVSVSPLSGSGNITSLRVENPEGFNSPYAFELDQVSVNIDVSTVLSDVIEVESITIVQPAVTYETKITTDNIRSLLDNLSSNDTSESEASSTDEAGQQIIIRELKILDAQLNFVAAMVTAPIPLADIELQNIGEEDDSTSVADALRMVLSELSRTILSADLPNLNQLRESVEGKLQDGVEGAVEDLGGRLRGLLN